MYIQRYTPCDEGSKYEISSQSSINSIRIYILIVAVNSLIDGLRPMDVGGVQLEFVERGGGGGCVVVVVVIVGLCSTAATVSVHVKVVVGQQQLSGIEDHVVHLLRSGDVGRHCPVGADKVHRPVVVHADRRIALVARRIRRRRRGRQLCIIIHVLYRHRVHQIQRFRAILGLDGGVLHLPGVVVIADAITTLLHLEALLLLLEIVVMVPRVMIVDGLVVLPTDAAVVAAALPRALMYGAAAQIQHGRRRTLVVSRRSVLSRWPLIDPLQLKYVVAVVAVGGGCGRLLHRLTVDGRRRLRPGHEPEVSGRHVLTDRRRWRRFGLKLL